MVQRTRFLCLDGLERQVAFQDAKALEAIVARFLPSWPFHWSNRPNGELAFAAIRPGLKRPWEITILGKEPREWDAVDTMCDLVAELAWERLRMRPDILSLHAAALEFSGRLVVFPDIKKSGKSTLSIALARLGHTVFADDVLPVEYGNAGQEIKGLASGAAPRLRVPLPSEFSANFHDWLAADSGPGNDRYKYVTDIPIGKARAAMPLGAIVVLDRREETTEPHLAPIAQSDALVQIIKQNFSRDQHAGRILRGADQLTRTLPLFRLTYFSGEEAANFLHFHPDLADLPSAVAETSRTSVSWSSPETQEFNSMAVYRHAAGLFETTIDDELYLTDETGSGIYRLNAGSVMIWRALSEPGDLAHVVTLLSAAFPDEDTNKIADDAMRTMSQFAKAGLIRS